jgi:hypothetical protein
MTITSEEDIQQIGKRETTSKLDNLLKKGGPLDKDASELF